MPEGSACIAHAIRLARLLVAYSTANRLQRFLSDMVESRFVIESADDFANGSSDLLVRIVYTVNELLCILSAICPVATYKDL